MKLAAPSSDWIGEGFLRPKDPPYDEEALEVVLRWAKVTRNQDRLGEAWLVMQKCLRSYRRSCGSLYPYFFSAMKRVDIDAWRRLKKRPHSFSLNDEITGQKDVEVEDFEAILKDIEERAPKGRWPLIVAVLKNGYIAGTAEIPMGSVKSLMNRFRSNLKKVDL